MELCINWHYYLRIYFFKNTQTEYIEDSYILAKLARGILHGEYKMFGFFWAAVQPLYPFLMALVNLVAKDLLLSGKIISLIAGVATVPVVYLLWNILESKETALLATGLVAVNEVAWYYSIHVFRDSLFLFFCILSFYFLFKTKDDFKWLPYMAVALGLATLTRGDGYFLTLAMILSFGYWNRENRWYLFGKEKFDGEKLKHVQQAVFVYLFISLPWVVYSRIVTGEFIPFHVAQEIAIHGRVGLNWFSSIIDLVLLPLFILSLAGIILSYENKEKYLPFYLFVVVFSIPHMWFSATSPRYALPFLPIFLGWASMAILFLFSKLGSISKKTRYFILVLLILTSFSFSFNIISMRELKGERFEVVRDAMFWFNSNAEKDAKIYVAEGSFYGYYTDRELIWDYQVFSWMYYIGEIYPNLPPLPAFIVSLVESDTHYFVAYDSLTPWFYEKTKPLTDKFTQRRFVFADTEVVASPLKKFERNNEVVYIYKLSWERRGE